MVFTCLFKEYRGMIKISLLITIDLFFMNIHETPSVAPLETKSKHHLLLVGGIIIAMLCIVAGVAYWYLGSHKNVQPLSQEEKKVIIENLNTLETNNPLSPQTRIQMIMGNTSPQATTTSSKTTPSKGKTN